MLELCIESFRNLPGLRTENMSALELLHRVTNVASVEGTVVVGSLRCDS